MAQLISPGRITAFLPQHYDALPPAFASPGDCVSCNMSSQKSPPQRGPATQQAEPGPALPVGLLQQPSQLQQCGHHQHQDQHVHLAQEVMWQLQHKSPAERAAVLQEQPSFLLAAMALAICQQCAAASLKAWQILQQSNPANPAGWYAGSSAGSSSFNPGAGSNGSCSSSSGEQAVLYAAALQVAAQATQQAVRHMKVARKLALAAQLKRCWEQKQLLLHGAEWQQQQQQQQEEASMEQQEQSCREQCMHHVEALEDVADSEEVCKAVATG